MVNPVPDTSGSGGSRWEFLKAFLQARRTIGAVAPTSRGLARRVVRLAEAETAQLVAEFGPGDGAITRELLAALPADGRLWAFEVYQPFVEYLRAAVDDRRFTVLAESAEGITGLRDREELPRFDAIVSAVPFSVMDSAQTARILQAAAQALLPGGVFVALQYHPRYLAPRLRAEFAVVEREVYPWNIPPAVLLRARAPRRSG